MLIKRRRKLLLGGVAALALVATACGGGSSTSTNKTGSASTSGGSGLSTPTKPSGAKLTGGTVTFSEGPSAAPNYIFPMTSAQFCGTNNVEQLSAMLYRPLYWFGNNYSPTIDYSYSVGEKPVYSNNNQTVTIKIKPWKWSDGETVTARDVEEYINIYKANPGSEYCGYVPGFFPDNVVSMSTPNPQTLVLNLNKSYDPEWFTYNELSQITPLPLAWDRTSLSQPAPTTDNGHLPDTTKAGAAAVYKFLDTQSKAVASWASSPVWSVVDGPFKLASFSNTGEVTMVPNPDYSGSPKPTISKFVEVPFTDDTAVFNEMRSGGPNALTIGGLPSVDAPQASTLTSEGYTQNKANSYSFNYFVLNQHNPKVGPVFSQVYFRQAFQHLIDQKGWVNAFLHNTAVPTYSPIPPAPPSPLASFNASKNPFPFSVADASSLLTKNGWKVVPGGTTTCVKPGTGPGECGAGITSGESISFNLDYQSGVATLGNEMQDLQSQAKKVGIAINLTTHPFNTVVSAASQCTAGQATCNWTAENWGAGWIYAPDFLPTGEELFLSGAAANFENYNNAKANQLINATVYGPVSQEKQALTNYAQYMEQQVPVVYGPTSIGTYQGDAGTMISNKLGGYTANAFGYVNPENWYLTK